MTREQSDITATLARKRLLEETRRELYTAAMQEMQSAARTLRRTRRIITVAIVSYTLLAAYLVLVVWGK